MIHLIFLSVRRPGVDRQAYLRDWRGVHAPLVAGLPGVRRYVQSTVRAIPGQVARFDTVDEIWVDDAAAMNALLHSADYARSALAGAGNLVDPRHCVRLQTTDHVVHAGPSIARDESLPKRMTFFRRKSNLSREDMLRYWRGTHGPLAASVPGLRRYVQSAMLPSAYEQGEPRFDGAAQIWSSVLAALPGVSQAGRSKLYRYRRRRDAVDRRRASHSVAAGGVSNAVLYALLQARCYQLLPWNGALPTLAKQPVPIVRSASPSRTTKSESRRRR
ncbi:EthD family reductase [Cupriavidus sp. AcVe19-1a]|uniref:EthD domain-containing protein n=1 Tax=Cupriavidus sp. AcVe19-1a TaxID=2821359 RepID=UPI001FD733C3|nr:EthD family reductase [Cupriavidus sp. AcVe19-1a]